MTQNGGALSGCRNGVSNVALGWLSTPEAPESAESSWFAIQTKPRHEKKVRAELEQKDIATFLPLITSVNHWSDRSQAVQLPLFGNYLFVSIIPDRDERVKILRTRGVMGFVGGNGRGRPIPEEQIDAVKTILREKLSLSPYPFLSVGQKVRVRGGSLDGLQGILLDMKANQTLVISIECIERSVAVQVEGYRVEAA